MADLIAIDTNVIVRYLTGDDKAQSASATDLFKAAEAGNVSLLITAATVQETVYVLESIYDLDATAITPKLISLLSIPHVGSPDIRWILEALQFYRSRSCDFGDAMLCAYSIDQGCGVATFDKGVLKKFPELMTATPEDWLKRAASDERRKD